MGKARFNWADDDNLNDITIAAVITNAADNDGNWLTDAMAAERATGALVLPTVAMAFDATADNNGIWLTNAVVVGTYYTSSIAAGSVSGFDTFIIDDVRPIGIEGNVNEVDINLADITAEAKTDFRDAVVNFDY